MFKVVRMSKRADKLPAEFRVDWLERHKELRRTASKLVASVAADGKPLGDDPSYDGMAALYFSTFPEAKAAREKSDAKGTISVVMDEKELFTRIDAALKTTAQLKVVLTNVRKPELTPAQFKDASLKAYAKVESKMLMESAIQKIVVSFAAPDQGVEPAFDSLLEIYFKDTDGLKAAFASPVISTLRKDEEPLVRLDAPELRIVAEENVL
jgi:hypothetical protein